jgi:glucose/arabinose dehydrogenase
MEDPVYHYASSAAISGLMFYSGKAFPQWRGNAFYGAMTPHYLARLTIAQGQSIREERMLLQQAWRVRAVQEGPDGFLYLTTEATERGVHNPHGWSGVLHPDGKLVRIRPIPASGGGSRSLSKGHR